MDGMKKWIECWNKCVAVSGYYVEEWVYNISTDAFPKYSDIVSLQRKWNDSAFLQIAVVDNGDISFHSFNSISLPTLIPHL
ncbi:hypothetical protein TNCV_3988091 [Trichonephila clavipes]|nr:hypothetical protein TNCV_3988091 [Trichonephila clavipes]